MFLETYAAQAKKDLEAADLRPTESAADAARTLVADSHTSSGQATEPSPGRGHLDERLQGWHALPYP